MTYSADGSTLIALPNGVSVPVAVLAANGVQGYSALAGGGYSVPGDAYAVGFGGTTYQVAAHTDWFPAVAAAKQQQSQPLKQDASTDTAASAATIKNLLHEFGLDELVPFVDGWVRDGKSWEEIELMLRDPSTKAGKIFDKMYPEVRVRAEKGLKPMAVAEIQAYRQTVAQVGRSLGLPEAFATKSFAQKLIEGDVSVTEFQDRANEYAALGLQELNADPVKRQELEAFQRYYNVKLKPGEIAGMIFNTDLAMPTLKKRIHAVTLDATAGRVGFGDLSQTEAERLATLGVGDQEATQGFGTLAESQQLFNPLPGLAGSEDTIGRADQLGAVFEGNAQARTRIARRARQRVATFEGGGGYATGQEGFAGVGFAQ